MFVQIHPQADVWVQMSITYCDVKNVEAKGVTENCLFYEYKFLKMKVVETQHICRYLKGAI